MALSGFRIDFHAQFLALQESIERKYLVGQGIGEVLCHQKMEHDIALVNIEVKGRGAKSTVLQEASSNFDKIG